MGTTNQDRGKYYGVLKGGGFKGGRYLGNLREA